MTFENNGWGNVPAATPIANPTAPAGLPAGEDLTALAARIQAMQGSGTPAGASAGAGAPAMPNAAGSADRALDWEDYIEKDEPEFRPLPEGDYRFTVAGLQRDSYPGGRSIPACPKARLTLRVETPDGIRTVYQDFFLCTSQEWKISGFFRCLGLKEPTERIRMPWPKAPGRSGRVHIRPRTYTGKDGAEHTANDLRFLDPDEEFSPAPAVAFTEAGAEGSVNDELPF